MRVAIIGSYGAGLTMRVPRFPLPGETLAGGVFSAGHGGKGSNQAVAAARLGASVSLCTALGPDAFATDARRLWAAEGIQATITDSKKSTMVGIIVVEPSGENRIVLASGALDDLDVGAVDAFEEQIATADVLLACLEVPLSAVHRGLQIARAHHVATILNPAPAPTVPFPDDLWPLIDVLTPNQGEALALVAGRTDGRTPTPEVCAALLRERWAGVIVMTLGSEGALLDDGRMCRRVPPAGSVCVVDTTGAGDAFNGALAVAMARGDDLDEATRFANAAGAHSVTVAEAIPSLGRPADLAELLG